MPEERRRETWDEIVDRSLKMHVEKFDSLEAEITEAFEYVRQKKVLPSMRGMQFAGDGVLRKNERLFNCASLHVYNTRCIEKAFYLLLCGVGCGFGLGKRWVDKFPPIFGDKTEQITFKIEDSIEGWAVSTKALIDSFLEGNDYTGKDIIFDYSDIREKGAPISHGGKAPGPEPLQAAHGRIRQLLVSRSGKLKTIEVYDILMYIADAVLSGGIRRSACIVLFDYDDVDMMSAKVGDWYQDNIQRARSNNSLLVKRADATLDMFDTIVTTAKYWGEPGFVLVDNEDALTNPCFTIDTRILTENGWRSFEALLDKDINIIQDNRVIGSLEDNKEVWDIDLANLGTSTNLATSIRKTGNSKEVYKLLTTSFTEVKGTPDHLFATTKGMVQLKDLKVGDEILVGVPATYQADVESDDWKLGFLAGVINGDGSYQRNSFLVDVWTNDLNFDKLTYIKTIIQDVLASADNLDLGRANPTPKFNKCLETSTYKKYRLHSKALTKVLEQSGFRQKQELDFLHNKSKDYKAGFISGMVFTDGHVEFNSKSGSLSVRISQSNLETLKTLKLLLLELGLFSKIYLSRPARQALLPDGRGGRKEYQVKANYRLSVQGVVNLRNLKQCVKLFGSKEIKFDESISTLTSNRNSKYTETVKSVEYDSVQDVYCLKEDVRRTLIAEGLTARRCAEVALRGVYKGTPVIQMCNLTTLNGNNINTREELLECVKQATIIGTLQAMYTDFPFLDREDEEITRDEALLGVSILGFYSNPDLFFDKEVLREAAEYAIEVNKEWASKLGINPAARVTCVKPDGNSSCVLESAFSGIHAAHAPKYIRRTQVNRMDPVYQYFNEVNPDLCEQFLGSKTDDVICFPIEVDNEHAVFKNELDTISHLEHIKLVQEAWVNPGSQNSDLTHAVSCTVIVDDEWDKLPQYLFDNKEYFTNVSFLAKTGDKDYTQAPYEAVRTEEDAVIWQSLKDKFQPVDYTQMTEAEDNTEFAQEVSCAGGMCTI